MPWHFCHLAAPHKKLRLPEWYVSSLMLDRAVDAILRRDYPIIQGVVLMFSAWYVLVNLAVDISYTLFDPRIRY